MYIGTILVKIHREYVKVGQHHSFGPEDNRQKGILLTLSILYLIFDYLCVLIFFNFVSMKFNLE